MTVAAKMLMIFVVVVVVVHGNSDNYGNVW